MLKRQLSQAPCLQAQSWGYDRGGVWVSQGCAAQFAVGEGGGQSKGGGDNFGAAVAGGVVGAVLGAAVSGGASRTTTTTHSVTRRTYTGPQQQDSAAAVEDRIHESRMDSIRAGMDPDTDVAAAQMRANQPEPQSPSDAVQRDINAISNSIDEDRARIEAATHGTTTSSSSSDESQREEYQANQDFQRQVMERRANENAQSNDSNDSDDSSKPDDPEPPQDAPEETPQF